MEQKNIDKILQILNNFLKSNNNHKENLMIQNLATKLTNLKFDSVNLGELEKIEKDIVYLDTTYDEFNELSNYFDPIYITLKKNIHKNEVEKIREENRRKKEGK
jgi:hypothetical protein